MSFFNILVLFCMFFDMFGNKVQADFLAKITKPVMVGKDIEVEARVESEKALIKGALDIINKPQNYYESKSTTEDNKIYIKITWTNLITQKGNVSVRGLTTDLTLEKPLITSGRAILIVGNTPSTLETNKSKDKDKDKDKDSLFKLPKLPSELSGLSGSNGITSGIPTQSAKNNLNEKLLVPPKTITTFDGCEHPYNQDKEIIRAYQRTYYIDNQGKEQEVTPCKLIKEYPAQKKACNTNINYDKKTAYKMYQPYFIKDKEEYGAGGCVVQKELTLQLDYDQCPAKAMKEKYIRQAKWYYENDDATKVYVSACVIDPENQEDDLLVEYEGCPVNHDINNATSKQLGRYYFVKDDNTRQYLTDCTETKESYFKHKIRWDEDRWKHFIKEWYSQRLLTRYIEIPSESREVIINNEELDPAKIKQQEKFLKWTHHDASLVSSKYNQRFISFNDFIYNIEIIEEKIPYLKLSDKHLYTTSCSTFGFDKVKTYVEQYKRGDGSIYDGRRYDTPCR